MNSKFKTLLITVSIAFLLSACGSGSGTNGDDDLLPESPPEDPEPVASMSQIISLLLVD
jgi:hypothetical protein